MNIWGMSGKGHDASIVVFKNSKVVFENYTRDREHDILIINQIKEAYDEPDLVVWYENPWKKMFRQWWDGHKNFYSENNIKRYLRSKGITCRYHHLDHHRSHSGHQYDSPYGNPLVIVADSIGDIDCTSVWLKNKKLASINYPHSIGLFYSSMVKATGMIPNQDEAEFEKISKQYEIDYDFKAYIKDRFIVDHIWAPLFKTNLHKGTKLNVSPEILAPVTQSIFEDMIEKIYYHWTSRVKCDGVVFAGGCAFNKSIRDKINVWVPKNPGDGGSARSCVWSYLNA
jgi:carbamoyltransferase